MRSSTLQALAVLSLLGWAAAACPQQFDSPACDKLKARAAELLGGFCNKVGYASACSSDLKTFDLLLHGCGEFPNQKECQSLSVCGDDLMDLAECAGSTIISTDDAYNSVQELCSTHMMDGCEACRAHSAMPTSAEPLEFKSICGNPLKTLSTLCGMMSMAPCAEFEKWCSGNDSKVCTQMSEEETVSDGSNSPMSMGDNEMSNSGHTHMVQSEGTSGGDDYSKLAAAMAGRADPCYTDPSAAKCATFELSPTDIEKDIEEICVTEGKAMPWMIGCNFWMSCKGENSGVCNPFSILATLCQDMPGMSGCSRYKQLCAVGSKVLQCGTGPIPQAPKTTPTQNSIMDACSDHSMPACLQCPSQGASCADPMSTMAELCHTMPSMAFCSTFESFCSATNNAFKHLCMPDSGRYLPPMRMYFHQSLRDLILFKTWIPENNAGYIGSVIAIIAAGIFVQFLKTWRNEKEATWYQMYSTQKDCDYCPTWTDCGTEGCEPDCGSCSQENEQKDPKKVFITVQQARRNVIRSLFTAFVVAIDYALMLVAMTFNVGFFLAVVAGFAIGTLIFGHRLEVANEPGTVSGQIAAYGSNPARDILRNANDTDCCSRPV